MPEDPGSNIDKGKNIYTGVIRLLCNISVGLQ